MKCAMLRLGNIQCIELNNKHISIPEGQNCAGILTCSQSRESVPNLIALQLNEKAANCL